MAKCNPRIEDAGSDILEIYTSIKRLFCHLFSRPALCFKQAVKTAKRAPTWTCRCQAKWHQNFPAGKLANRLHNEVGAKDLLLHFNLQSAKEMYSKLPCSCVGT